ncbi:MAG: hypothetical protein ITD33_07560 [Nitrosarchaeum sp.]|nr:hypothetical protein [Nitrosarchaeum sp.]MBP0120689.1 hypothetical protein [Nitrosarchaeum sp.]MBP0133894.1 hypothetical protein [Nitrosarchaeum sp.]MDW7641908.1 hypothetical protein [Nitrosarchaeum sp.]
MNWPGMGDPYKRKKTLRFLALSAGIGAIAVLITVLVVNPLIGEQPRSACIGNIQKNWKISFTVELYVDNQKAEIPSNVGFMEGGCQRAIYTLTDDGTVYAEWKENPQFEIGHFLWIFKFPLRDMDESKSKIFVNGIESENFISTPLQNGYHYKGMFTSKAYDEAKDKDYLPPQN